MALRQEGGLAGLELVPDLAVGLPELSADRKTYTFVLRRGIKYSDGTEVVPDDVRHGFERLFTVTADGTDHPAYFANLLGAAACTRLPKTCSLATGVETDPRTNTIRIHLTRPDPDFLYKLALPWASVAPPSAPSTDFGDTPFPGTGPYMISQFTGPLEEVS